MVHPIHRRRAWDRRTRLLHAAGTAGGLAAHASILAATERWRRSHHLSRAEVHERRRALLLACAHILATETSPC